MDDTEKLVRLFKCLNKEHFDSLSFDEQEKLLDEIVDTIEENNIPNNIVMQMINNNTEKLTFKDILEKLGKDEFKKMLRDAISKDAFIETTIDLDDIKNVIEKSKKGLPLTEREKDILKIIDGIMDSKMSKKEDVGFTTFAILKILSGIIRQGSNKKDDDPLLYLKDLEPVVLASYIYSIACCLNNPSTIMSKTFRKHGLGKAMLTTYNTALSLSEHIIDYFKENNIEPEEAIVSLLYTVKTITAPLDMTLEGVDNDKIESLLESLLTYFHFEEDSTEENESEGIIKEILIGSNDKNENNTTPPNGGKKESNKKTDLRSILLDD